MNTLCNGFILVVGDAKLPITDTNNNYVKSDVGYQLLADNIKRRNLIIKDSDEYLTIYTGDRDPIDYKTVLACRGDQYCENYTGITLLLHKPTGNTSIYSDLLGSEQVFYTKYGKGFVVTNRLDNLVRCGIASQPDLVSVYSYLSNVFTVGDRTLLKNVFQLQPMETLFFDNRKIELKKRAGTTWKSSDIANTDDIYQQVDERMFDILNTAPRTNLMLSAGWDSRVLLSTNPERITASYTHGDILSREVKIAFELGRRKNLKMIFSPLEAVSFDADSIRNTVKNLGQCIFPHWHYAAKHTFTNNHVPLTAGLGVEIFSGHYGVNSLSYGKDKLKKLAASMLRPSQYDQMKNEEAIGFLTPLLSAGFGNSPWFFNDSVETSGLRKEHKETVRKILTKYSDTQTEGAQELCERFKLEHQSRQFYALQTKSAINHGGYFHPYIDSKLNKTLLKLKYKDRVNYKVSQYVVSQRDPSLLELPLAATLAKASSPVLVQEASRLVRIAIEKISSFSKKSVHKGLGWNNFQFLKGQECLHDYVDSLSNASYWNKTKMHNFISAYELSGYDIGALLEMLMKIVSVDYQLNPMHYESKKLESLDLEIAS